MVRDVCQYQFAGPHIIMHPLAGDKANPHGQSLAYNGV